MAKTSRRSNHGPRKEANTFYQATGNQREEASEKRRSLATNRPKICYRCGQDGHYKGRCTNEPDVEKVNSELIKFIDQGNGQGHLRWAAQKHKSYGPD